MNRFEGHISKIRTHGPLSMVSVALPGTLELRAIVIESPDTATYLREGNRIAVLFKETEVILCTGDSAGTSILNRIPAEVRDIEQSALLSRVALHSPAGTLDAIVPSESLPALGLRNGMQIMALVKTNEVMLSAL